VITTKVVVMTIAVMTTIMLGAQATLLKDARLLTTAIHRKE